MRTLIALALAAMLVAGCNTVQRAAVDGAVKTRIQFNNDETTLKIIALCEARIGALHRLYDEATRDEIIAMAGRLCPR